MQLSLFHTLTEMVWLHTMTRITCNVPIVFFQLMGFYPLISTLLVYMDLMIVWTYSNF